MHSIRKSITLSFYSLPLFTAAILYFFFREPNTVFHSFIQNTTGLIVADFRFEYELPDWIVYNLPGALWLFSFALLASKLFARTKQQSLVVISAMTCVMILIESLQGVGITDGTFDYKDLFAYAFAAIGAYYLSDRLSFQNLSLNLSWKQKRFSLISLTAIFIALIYLSDVQ